jgi:hypothetical protein
MLPELRTLHVLASVCRDSLGRKKVSMGWQRHVEYMIGQMIWAVTKWGRDLLEESLTLLASGTILMVLWDQVAPEMFGFAAMSWLQAMAITLAFRIVVRGRPVDLDIEMSPAEKEAFEAEKERERLIEAGEDPDRPSFRVIRNDDA